jgi:hypothetical protein
MAVLAYGLHPRPNDLFERVAVRTRLYLDLALH